MARNRPLLTALTPLAALAAVLLTGCGSSGSTPPTTITKTPPKITILQQAKPGVARGDLFIAPKRSTGGGGTLIIDDRGRTVWYRPVPVGQAATDFKLQRYDGKPVMTWWQGTIGTGKNGVPLGVGHGVGMIYGVDHRRIAEVHAGDGAQADLHEFSLTKRGTALITAYKPVKRDLSALGGPKDGTVLDSEVQEVDVKTGKVLFLWKSLDHVPVSDSYAKPDGSKPFDYFHINAIEVEPDGNLLVSSRNTWTVYEIDHRTGRVIWRLGGKHSDFKLGPGVRFAWQHDARRQPNGTLTIFDNEAAPKVRSQTRGLVLRLDMKHMRASLVRSYTHKPDPLLAGYEGSVQPLPNGDVLMGWGAPGYVTEFSHSGKVLLDLKMPKGWDTYRAYRFHWPPRGS